MESKHAAADYLRALDVHLRQSKAALTNVHVANVVERQRLTDAVSPMLRVAKIRATQHLAEERRQVALYQVASKANFFVRKVGPHRYCPPRHPIIQRVLNSRFFS